MSESSGPAEKAKEAGRKVADTLEPDDQSYDDVGGAAGDASDPLSGGARSDEQTASDEPGGGIG